jgi:hypothetical protein
MSEELDFHNKSEQNLRVAAKKAVIGICTPSVRRRSSRVSSFGTRFSFGRAFRRTFGFAIPASGSANPIRPITRDLHLFDRDNTDRRRLRNERTNTVGICPKIKSKFQSYCGFSSARNNGNPILGERFTYGFRSKAHLIGGVA